MIGPTHQGFADLFGIGAVIVGPRDACLVPTPMIEDRLDDVRRDAEVAKAGGATAPKIVDSPLRRAEACVERGFRREPRCEALEDEALGLSHMGAGRFLFRMVRAIPQSGISCGCLFLVRSGPRRIRPFPKSTSFHSRSAISLRRWPVSISKAKDVAKVAGRKSLPYRNKFRVRENSIASALLHGVRSANGIASARA